MATIIQELQQPNNDNVIITYELNSVQQAVDTIVGILHRAGYRNIARHRLNDGKHWIITGESSKTHAEEIFYIKWEKELFHKASIYVPELTGTKGALTINPEFARKAKQLNAVILFCQKDHGIIYGITADDFIKKSFPHKQVVGDETVLCIGIESINPWQLPQQIKRERDAFLRNARNKLEGALGSSSEKQQRQEPQKEKAEDTILILKCLDCGYASVQTKQDPKAIMMLENRDFHAKIFEHTLKFEQVSRSDPVALKLRENLHRWERW